MHELYPNFSEALKIYRHGDSRAIAISHSIQKWMNAKNSSSLIRPPSHPFDMVFFYQSVCDAFSIFYDQKIETGYSEVNAPHIDYVVPIEKNDYSPSIFLRTNLYHYYIDIVNRRASQERSKIGPFDIYFACKVLFFSIDQNALDNITYKHREIADAIQGRREPFW